MKKLILPLFVCATLIGCASVTQDKNQAIKVETKTVDGEKVENASCILKNDRGEFYADSPRMAQVRKSAGDLIITCEAPDQPIAEGKLISRAGAAVFGNIIFGGIIGGVVDTASGVAFNYPEWVELVFGKTLVFDRSNYKANTIQIGEEAETKDEQNHTPAQTSIIVEETDADKIET